jgi:hypothetical protein
VKNNLKNNQNDYIKFYFIFIIIILYVPFLSHQTRCDLQVVGPVWCDFGSEDTKPGMVDHASEGISQSFSPFLLLLLFFLLTCVIFTRQKKKINSSYPFTKESKQALISSYLSLLFSDLETFCIRFVSNSLPWLNLIIIFNLNLINK